MAEPQFSQTAPPRAPAELPPQPEVPLEASPVSPVEVPDGGQGAEAHDPDPAPVDEAPEDVPGAEVDRGG